ncbi:MAG TPA: HEAT repeat domain-containing protein [Planctomycetota bacterium]|jgi:HEAT repeat protein
MFARTILSLALLVTFFPLAQLLGAEPEADLIVVLKSDKAANEKADACRKLKTSGTAAAAPALAALLPDKELSMWARFALQSIPAPEAGAALRDALPKAEGLLKAGICDSLGERREPASVAALAPLASDADAVTASSAAHALGRIGGADALTALKAAKGKAPTTAQAAITDGILACAEALRAGGDKKSAAGLYQELYEGQNPEHIRNGAYRGLVLSSDAPTALVVKALTGDEKAAQRAALQLVRQIKSEGATTAFADVLAKVKGSTQAALVEALQQRGDAAAAPAVAALLSSETPEVRIAALKALQVLGSAATAPQLAEIAAKATGAEQDLARESLNVLRDPKVSEALLEKLPSAPPAMQAEIARALGYRKEAQAVPALLKMAKSDDEAARTVAFKSLAMLADGSASEELIKLLAAAKSDVERAAAEQAALAACGRNEKPQLCVPAVLGAMNGAAPATQIALLRVAARLGGPEALSALRSALQDKDAAIQEAALRTAADFGGPEAFGDLLKLAKDSPSLAQKVLALRGCWRVIGLATALSADERFKLSAAAMAASQRPEEKKLGLTELSKMASPDALKLTLSLCDDEAVRSEAELAVVSIATALAGSQAALAKPALEKIAASKNEAAATQAKKTLGGLDQGAGFITTWLAAGPYRQDGKKCKDLFDIAFAPEQEGKEVKWVPAPKPADPALFWQTDLLPICGGESCVVYQKARISSPKEQKVRLEIGSDDGVKVWLNGKVVHANNAERALTAGEDKAQATLKAGANDLLLKITQNIMGCGACVRVRTLEGGAVEGLTFSVE